MVLDIPQHTLNFTYWPVPLLNMLVVKRNRFWSQNIAEDTEAAKFRVQLWGLADMHCIARTFASLRLFLVILQSVSGSAFPIRGPTHTHTQFTHTYTYLSMDTHIYIYIIHTYTYIYVHIHIQSNYTL